MKKKNDQQKTARSKSKPSHKRQSLASKITSRKSYMIKVMKAANVYRDELAMQVQVAARLYVKIKEFEKEMSKDGYSPVSKWESREGAVRQAVNPLEELYSDYLSRYQQALKALGLNNDSKERKSQGDDPLNSFLDKFRE